MTVLATPGSSTCCAPAPGRRALTPSFGTHLPSVEQPELEVRGTRTGSDGDTMGVARSSDEAGIRPARRGCPFCSLPAPTSRICSARSSTRHGALAAWRLRGALAVDAVGLTESMLLATPAAQSAFDSPGSLERRRAHSRQFQMLGLQAGSTLRVLVWFRRSPCSGALVGVLPALQPCAPIRTSRSRTRAVDCAAGDTSVMC